MNGCTNRTWRAVVGSVLLAAALALPAAPAHAHGIGGEAADLGILGFVPLGIEHMLLGWDHLLFAGGVVLVAREARRAVKLISLFVVGHSATLIAATLAGWRVDAGLVDVVIAASVAFVGAVGAFYRRLNWRVLGVVVLAFGLVHGLGLATRLQDLGLPEQGVLPRVLAFNVGIEIGQVTAIAVMAALGLLVTSLVGQLNVDGLRTTLSAGLLAVGAAATVLVGFQAADLEGEQEAGVEEASGCVVGDRTRPFPATGGHAEKNFFEPEEEAPLGDFGHSVGDGFVVVLYDPDLDPDGVEQLRDLVAGEAGQGMLAAADPELEPGQEGSVVAITRSTTMTCAEVDLEALTSFRDAWFDSLGG